ncbi:GNAT family N-acetyltransferase [Streptomyces sp. NPDC057540]|uniref:GNAT family N-acetyltransferase n=1 Tax=Streptomyces sp. NPDC057540 TaxID=3346160 RepID=UPI00369028CC
MSWDELAHLELANDRVTLRRVGVADTEAFGRIAYEPEIWRYFVQRIATPDDLHAFVETAIRDTLNGTRVVFAVVDNTTGRIVGSTAYGNLAASDRRLEIGWSWLYAGARRSGVNRAVKLALLDHAFDVLGCARVEFKTDVLNTGARAGLAGIGAVEEGVLRSFNIMPGGRRRDVVYYSILRDEWPTVRKERFEARGAGTAAGPGAER